MVDANSRLQMVSHFSGAAFDLSRFSSLLSFSFILPMHSWRIKLTLALHAGKNARRGGNPPCYFTPNPFA